MIEPLIEMTNQLNQLQQAMVAGERVFALLDETRESTEGEMRPLKGQVSFERVSFSYDGEQQVLRDVSFTTKPGQMLALVGHTGSGKSTIISLLMGFYPLDQGTIRFDDQPMASLSLSAVRRSIGLVQQDPFIFVGTLAENLRLGRDGIDEARLWQALTEVQLAEFVLSLPDGLGTLMEEGARTSPPASANCSPCPRPGGRSAHPHSGRGDCQRGLPDRAGPLFGAGGGTARPYHHRHRPPPLDHRRRGRILLLSRGQVNERGSHGELMALGGHYAQLFEMQSQEPGWKRGGPDRIPQERAEEPVGFPLFDEEMTASVIRVLVER